MILDFTLLKTTGAPRGALSKDDYRQLAGFVLEHQGVQGPVELSVDITGHQRIQELNRRYRGVDRTTDVISFRNDGDPCTVHRAQKSHGARSTEHGALSGDLAINVHQAAIQAKKIGHSLRREMRLLLIHGILHLLGYTDYETVPRRRMFKRQNALLRAWEKRHRG